MKKSDISGKKLYKELLIRPFKRNFSHCCFVAVRTTLEPLDFFAGIYQYSNHLFQLSEQTMDLVMNSIHFSFQSFEIQDILSENKAYCIVNKSIEKEQYLFGKNKNSCYFLSQKPTGNQILLAFENEEKKNEQCGEEDDWKNFKNNMELTSVNLMDKIDYLFPLEIQTYEILKPLFLRFFDIPFLDHQIINSKNVNEIELFFSLYEGHIDKLKKNNL